MLKYGLLAKGIEIMCFRSVLKTYASNFPDTNTKKFKKKVKKIFREMLERTPDIGGSSLESNLYIAAFVFSIYKADKDRITPEIMDEMITAVFNSTFIERVHKNKKCTLFDMDVQNKKIVESIASQNSKFELDWKFEYVKGKDEFYNTYTECGICKLGKRENCLEFVPCLCNMDERSYRLEGGELHRSKTLANGDECCDFHVVKIK